MRGDLYYSNPNSSVTLASATRGICALMNAFVAGSSAACAKHFPYPNALNAEIYGESDGSFHEQYCGAGTDARRKRRPGELLELPRQRRTATA